MAWWEITIFGFALLLMLTGLVGTVLPVIPGIPLIFVAALAYAILEGFKAIDSQVIAIFAILTGAALVIDYLATVVGIKKMGGSYFGVAGAVFGMILGFIFAAGIFGLIIGAFAGAFFFEMLIGRNSRQALKAGFGTFVGFFVGGILKFAIGAAMIGIFVWKVLGS